MTAYRETPQGEPLIWATRDAIFALDPGTGMLRWRCNIQQLRRIFRLGDRLFVLTGFGDSGVLCIDMNTGQSFGSVSLEFEPSAGIVADDKLYVAGRAGAAALTSSGEVLWTVNHEFAKGFSLKNFFVGKSADGIETWREEVIAANDNPGLVLGHKIAQPDLDYRR